MSTPHILVVEDELDLAELISFHIVKSGYEVTEAHDGEQALFKAQEHNFDLIVLDLMLPKVDGMTVFSELRSKAKTREIPVIMLTAKGQPVDRIAGLEAGADDYVTKPFVPKELMLRIKKQLSSVEKTKEGHLLKIDELVFDKMKLTFTSGGEVVDLTVTEFKLLLYLCERPNQIQSRPTLLKEVWGYSDDVNSRTLDTHMKRIRNKLVGSLETIQTIRGKGYMYQTDD